MFSAICKFVCSLQHLDSTIQSMIFCFKKKVLKEHQGKKSHIIVTIIFIITDHSSVQRSACFVKNNINSNLKKKKKRIWIAIL